MTCGDIYRDCVLPVVIIFCTTFFFFCNCKVNYTSGACPYTAIQKNLIGLDSQYPALVHAPYKKVEK